jgi:hypothetical protein
MGEMVSTPVYVEKVVARLGGGTGRLTFRHEAGTCGYVVDRDETSQIQAPDRSQPGHPLKRGRGQTEPIGHARAWRLAALAPTIGPTPLVVTEEDVWRSRELSGLLRS